MAWEAAGSLTEGRFLPKLELIKPRNVPNSEQARFLSRVDKEKGKAASHQVFRGDPGRKTDSVASNDYFKPNSP